MSGSKKGNAPATAPTSEARRSSTRQTGTVKEDNPPSVREAKERLGDKRNATEFLLKYELIPEGEQPNLSALAHGLLHLAAASKTAALTDGLVAFATYAGAIQELGMAEDMWNRVKVIWTATEQRLEAELEDADGRKKKMEEQTDQLQATAKNVEGAVGRVTIELQKLAKEQTRLVKEMEELKVKQAEMAEGATQAFTRLSENHGNATTSNAATTNSTGDWARINDAEFPTPPNSQSTPSYAAIVHHALPTTHATTLARQDQKARQVLIDANIQTDTDGHTLNERELLAKAQLALEACRVAGLEVPPDMRFASVRRLNRTKGLLYETDSATSARWLQDAQNMKTFTNSFGSGAVLKARPWACLFYNVPCYFHITPETVQQLERDNKWTKGEIAGIHWIKPENRRRTGQQTAHLIVKFSTAERANNTIMKGAVVAGRSIIVERLVREARRCHNCQQLEPGHMAGDCPNATVCGSCGDDHQTSDCEAPAFAHNCVNCKTSRAHLYDHAAWDRVCPSFVEASRKIQKANPIEQYLYYPLTNDKTTWALREEIDLAQPVREPFGTRTTTGEGHRPEAREWIPGPGSRGQGGRGQRDGDEADERTGERGRRQVTARGSNAIPVNRERARPFGVPLNAAKAQAGITDFRGSTGKRQATLTGEGGFSRSRATSRASSTGQQPRTQLDE